MHRGYTKRWRKRWDKGYHRDHLLWILMDYFIDHANHKDTKVYFQGCGLIPVKRGQHIFGTLQLSVFLGVDRSRLRRKLKILETVGFSTIKTTNKYSIITVINYDTYQPMQTEIDQQIGQQPTSNRPATDQQPTTPNNVNNVKNKKNTNNAAPKKKKFVLVHYPFPDWVDKNLFLEWAAMREKIKKPIASDGTVKRAINALKKIIDQGHKQSDVIELAIDRNWQAFYPPKNGTFDEPTCPGPREITLENCDELSR